MPGSFAMFADAGPRVREGGPRKTQLPGSEASQRVRVRAHLARREPERVPGADSHFSWKEPDTKDLTDFPLYLRTAGAAEGYLW